jgi:hypothetical protein
MVSGVVGYLEHCLDRIQNYGHEDVMTIGNQVQRQLPRGKVHTSNIWNRVEVENRLEVKK